MNYIITFMLMLFFYMLSHSAEAQNYNYLSAYDSDGVPLDMVNTPVSQNLVDNIAASLPENYPVPTYNPEYLASSIETNVEITELADVWVTFVGEGAGYKNVLGYYSYDTNNPPTTVPADQDITIIFPNVSASGSGGGLEIGDKMYLGQFPADKTIGWVLIANGWDGNAVTYGNWIVYSDTEFNPEGSVELQKHNVNLYDNNEEVVVFGFEDIRRDYGSCDQDFNDALFLVTSNPYTAIETDNYNPISQEGGAQGGGGSGGLESNRGLSSKIAKRTFLRIQNNTMESVENIRTRSGEYLEDIVPNSFKPEDNSYLTSPRDLESLTKAEFVWSKDYFLNESRYATVFVTETSDGVYDHTKAVCERLKSAEILKIKNVTIGDDKFQLVTLKTNTGSIEYSISFSMEKISELEHSIVSKWAIEQYPKDGDFYNFQVWSSAPYQTIDIVSQILGNASILSTEVIKEESESTLPEIFISKGRYENDKIILEVQNEGPEDKEVAIIASIAHSENDTDLEHLYEERFIPIGKSTLSISSEESSLFDLEIKIQELNTANYDVAYFSDGAWGVDFDMEKTFVSNLKYESNMASTEEDYYVHRNISIDVSSTDYISVYKHLKPSGVHVDLSEYNALQFETVYEGPIEVRMIKNSIDKWEDQFLFTVHASKDKPTCTIPFDYLRNQLGGDFTADDVVMLMFVFKSPGEILQKIDVRNVRMTNVENVISNMSIELVLMAYPNPANSNCVILYESNSNQSMDFEMYNLMGEKVINRNVKVNEGLNQLDLDLGAIPSGSYYYHFNGEAILTESMKIIVLKE